MEIYLDGKGENNENKADKNKSWNNNGTQRNQENDQNSK